MEAMKQSIDTGDVFRFVIVFGLQSAAYKRCRRRNGEPSGSVDDELDTVLQLAG